MNLPTIVSLLVVVATFVPLSSLALDQATDEKIKATFGGSSHSNNWAVLVCTSRFWFNYRHVANSLSVYRSVKRLGIPDSQIILMLSDDMACNPRNPRPGEVFNNKNEAIDVYGRDVEVDYRGNEVTVENFLRVLTNRLPEDTPRSKRLNTDDRSNVLVYMTGHGGEDFLKFQDAKEVSNVELADAFGQMWEKKRYNELLFIIDTCQAVSLYSQFYSPNIIAIGSSQIGEDSLSHHVDPSIGVYIIDRYTYHLLEFLERITAKSKKKMMTQLFQICPVHQCRSTVGVSSKLFRRDTSKTLITDFFGSVRHVDMSADDSYYYFDVEPLNETIAEDEPAVEHLTEFVDSDVLDTSETKHAWDAVGFNIGGCLSALILLLFCHFAVKGLMS